MYVFFGSLVSDYASHSMLLKPPPHFLGPSCASILPCLVSMTCLSLKFSTVAGFVLNQLNKIPAIGDKFEYLDWQFEIVDMDRNKIDKILISGKQPHG